MTPQDLPRTLRRLHAAGWLDGARRFASLLRAAPHEPGRLLVVGTPEHEPWHLTAHLADAARWRGIPALRPVLVRRQVPEGAPPHLSIGLEAVHRAGRGASVLVAAEELPDPQLLERLADARRGGATLFALGPADGDLDGLAHEALALPGVPDAFDTASHVLSSDLPDTGGRLRRLLQVAR